VGEFLETERRPFKKGNRIHMRKEVRLNNSSSLNAQRPDLKDPCVVLSLLEADQVVAAKQQSHFGRRNLSIGMRALLWGLRIYVVIMFAIIAISVVRAIHALH
jgi:hypothetical protein